VGAKFSGPFDPKKGTGAGLAINVPWRGSTNSTKVALAHIGPVSAGNEDNLNYKEQYSLRVFSGASGVSTAVDNGPWATNAVNGSNVFRIPYSYAGTKTFADYDAYANSFIYDINIPGCASPGRVFAGQRQEPFSIALGQTFDLINYNPLTPGQSDENNSLRRKAVNSFVVEAPISCLVGNGNGVIGGWGSIQHLGHVGDNHAHVAGAQKTRLGNPLTNELFIGLTDKDYWNSDYPRNDIKFKAYLDYPTFPEIVDILFGGGSNATSLAPDVYPRVDISTVVLQGVPFVAALNYGTMQTTVGSSCGTISAPPFADMIRLNTSIAPTPAASQNPFGILGNAPDQNPLCNGMANNSNCVASGNDLAGFPNGRRPGDDAVDIYLRVAMGALCWPPFNTLLGICQPSQAPIGYVSLTDHAPVNASYFRTTFPYLPPPTPGNLVRCQ
jgi:hypothetical protein